MLAKVHALRQVVLYYVMLIRILLHMLVRNNQIRFHSDQMHNLSGYVAGKTKEGVVGVKDLTCIIRFIIEVKISLK